MSVSTSFSHLNVEQVEVIRRLRNSGAQLQQIAEAYQVFDKLDKELGSFGLVQKCSNPQTNQSLTNKTSSLSGQSSSGKISVLSIQNDNNGENVFGISNASLISSQKGVANNTVSSETNILANNGRLGDIHLQRLDRSNGQSLPEGVLKEASRCFLFSVSKDFIVELIKKCSLTIPNFNPWLLTKVHGIEHEEVKTFLSGDISSLESDNQIVIIDWFIEELHKADWFIEEVTEYSQNFMSQESPEAAEVDFTPRRERFTFRDVHLAVLESNFKKNQYPSPGDKKVIANECNIKMAMTSGQELSEKERVTVVNVDNWFRNKRKDAIRKAKIERIEASQAQAGLSSQASLTPGAQQIESSFANVYNHNHHIYPPPLTYSDNLSKSYESNFQNKPSLFIPSRPLNSFQLSSQGNFTSSGASSHSLIQSSTSEWCPIGGPNASVNDLSMNNITVKEEPQTDDQYAAKQDSNEAGPTPSKSQKLCVSFNFTPKSLKS